MVEPAQGPTKARTDEEDQSPLAEMLEAPPSAIARGAIYLMVALAVAGVAWAGWGEIDEVVTAAATVAPVGRETVIQAPVRGSVEAVLVDEGSAVEPGQKLLVLWSADAAQLRAAVRKQETALARARADGSAALAVRLDRLRQEIAEREATLAALKDASAAKVARLRAADRASALELEEVERDARLETIRHESGIAGAKRRAAEMQEAAQESVKALERELEDARRALTETLGAVEFDPENEGRVVLVSHARGIVGPLRPRPQGTSVERGQALLALLPGDAAMAAHISLQQTDLMKVRPGQIVRLKLQSFPYQQFGGLTGKVKEISRIAVRTDQGPATFSVVAILERGYFTRQGQRIVVAPGSAGAADIVVGRSSLLARTLAAFRDLEGE